MDQLIDLIDCSLERALLLREYSWWIILAMIDIIKFIMARDI